MPSRPPLLVCSLLSAVTMLSAPTAGADQPAAPDAEEPAPDPVPPAPDQVGGHFLLDVGASWVLASGALTDSGLTSPTSGPGLMAFGGIGVSRHLALGIEGEWLSLGSPEACSACNLQGTSIALFGRFATAQGQRLSAWVGAGLAYRSFDVTGAPAALVGDYSGLELLHVRTGASWYAFSSLTLSPGLALSAFTPGTRPATAGPAGTLWLTQLTLAVGIDVPGR